MSWNSLLYARPATGSPTALAVAADATLIATAGEDRTVLLDGSGRELWQASTDGATVRDLWLVPSRGLLLIHRDDAIAAIDTATGRLVSLPAEIGTAGGISGGALSADGRLFSVTAYAGSVRVLDLETGRVTAASCPEHSQCPAWRPGTGQLWFATAEDLMSWDWRATAPRKEPVALSHEAPIGRLVWSAHGSRLMVPGSSTGNVFAVDSNGVSLIGTLPAGRSAAFCANGGLVIATGSGIEALDAGLAAMAGPPTMLPACLTVSAAGGALAFAGTDGSLEIWEIAAYRDPASAGAPHTAAVMRWAAAMARTIGRDPWVQVIGEPGTSAVRTALRGTGAADTHPPIAWSPDGETCYVSAAPGTLTALPASGDPPRWERPLDVQDRIADIAVAPVGCRLIATTSDDRVVALVIDTETGEVLARPAAGRVAAWRPDGRQIAVSAVRTADRPGDRASVALLAEPWQAAAETLPSEGRIGRFAFSPDGAYLAVAGTQTCVWTSEGGSWQRHTRLEAGKVSDFSRIAFSPDGSLLAATPTRGGHPAVIWNVGTWKHHRSFGRPGGDPLAPALAWSPDGHVLAFPGPGRDSRIVELWDAEYGQLLGVLDPPASAARQVWAIVWCLRTGRLATTYSPGHAVTWDFPQAGTQPYRALRRTAVAPGVADTRLGQERRDLLARLASAAAAGGAAVSLDTLTRLHHLFGAEPTTPADHLAGEGAADPYWHLDDALSGTASVRGARELGWPADAVVGLVVLAARELTADPLLLAPAGVALSTLGAAAAAALDGSPVPPEPRRPPAGEFVGAAAALDRRSLNLLRMIGPYAVAADPLLPSRLHGLHLGLLPVQAHDRRLAGTRIRGSGSGGSVEGRTAGDGIAGIARSGPARALLSTQLALEREVFAMRAARGELLYRTGSTALPSRGRPLVAILDDTAAATGTIAVNLRLVVHLAAVALIDLGYACELVTLAAPGRRHVIDGDDTLAAIWHPCSLERADLARALRQADEAARRWAVAVGPQPRIVLLTHEFREAPAATPVGACHVDVLRACYPHLGRTRPMTGPEDDPFLISAVPTAQELRRLVMRLLAP